MPRIVSAVATNCLPTTAGRWGFPSIWLPQTERVEGFKKHKGGDDGQAKETTIPRLY